MTTPAEKTNTLKPQVVFVLGGPGAGKGTQCSNIVTEFGWIHLSAGDLLRDERKKNGPHAAMIEECIVQGKIVPAELTVELLKNAIMDNTQNGKTQFLVDGFPRNVDNFAGWKKVLGDSVELLFVLFFDCDEAKMRERLLTRGLTSGRSDDNDAAIIKRFQTYVTESRPIIESFDAAGQVRRIDANQTIEQVWDEVKKIFTVVNRKIEAAN